MTTLCYIRIKPENEERRQRERDPLRGRDNNSHFAKELSNPSIDGIFNQECSNETLGYSIICYNKSTTVICYGSTNTGKSYTSLGLLKSIFCLEYDKKRIKAFEIYNNDVYDILDERKKLKFHANAKEIPLNGSTDSYKALTKIRTCRTTKDNGVHKRSSRSHAIYVVTCGSYVYTIVDLAGFESNVNAESQYINVSLYCLRECVLALGKKNMYVNFRQSRLTYCLQDLLSHSISCICTVSLDDEEATRNTIAYGISMKEIKRHLKTTLKKTTIKNYYNHTKRVTQLEENVIKAYNSKTNHDSSLVRLLVDLLKHRLETTKYLLSVLTT